MTSLENTESLTAVAAPTSTTRGSYLAHLLDLLKSSGLYALGSLASPLVSLVLSPFLTHRLSQSDYGALAVLNITISLIGTITQLGLATSFFRAYNWDYEDQHDRFAVLTTSLLLLLVVSTPAVLLMMAAASWLASVLLGASSFEEAIRLMALVIFVQNLSLPCLLWLRAQKRALLFSLLSISNLLVTLVGTLFFVGSLQMGLNGSLLAVGGGYTTILLIALPLIAKRITLRRDLRIRFDIGRNLLTFGLPIVFSAVAAWALQLADRYLLTYLGSLAQTASYTVAYTLGGALAPVILTPFGMAWPPMMYSIARRKNAADTFKLIFRWYSAILFFFAFFLSLMGTALLYLLFPREYHPIAPLIPIIAISYAFYGIYSVLSIGTYIRRKTSYTIIFTTTAALANIGLNFLLIPLYGPMGAALATLLAFILLALIAYIFNQRIYPLPFEIGLFTFALLLGGLLYGGGFALASTQQPPAGWSILSGALLLYGVCLALLLRSAGKRNRGNT